MWNFKKPFVVKASIPYALVSECVFLKPDIKPVLFMNEHNRGGKEI